jgi:hypothetical protein
MHESPASVLGSEAKRHPRAAFFEVRRSMAKCLLPCGEVEGERKEKGLCCMKSAWRPRWRAEEGGGVA